MLEADLYVMIGQVVDEVALRLSSFSLKNEYIIKLVDAICQCIQDYVDILEKLCYQELHKDIAKIHGNRPNNVSTFGCSRAVYIQVTINLDTCFRTWKYHFISLLRNFLALEVLAFIHTSVWLANDIQTLDWLHVERSQTCSIILLL